MAITRNFQLILSWMCHSIIMKYKQVNVHIRKHFEMIPIRWKRKKLVIIPKPDQRLGEPLTYTLHLCFCHFGFVTGNDCIPSATGMCYNQNEYFLTCSIDFGRQASQSMLLVHGRNCTGKKRGSDYIWYQECLEIGGLNYKGPVLYGHTAIFNGNYWRQFSWQKCSIQMMQKISIRYWLESRTSRYLDLYYVT